MNPQELTQKELADLLLFYEIPTQRELASVLLKEVAVNLFQNGEL